MALHFMILYVPFFTRLFAITSLTWTEWQGVLWISLPVVVLDELLKWVSRTYYAPTGEHVVKHYDEEGKVDSVRGRSKKRLKDGNDEGVDEPVTPKRRGGSRRRSVSRKTKRA